MGTNFYLRMPMGKEDLHIGKRSAGWYFCFQQIAEEDIFSVVDWIKWTHKYEIYDEYGEIVSFELFWDDIDCNYRDDLEGHTDSENSYYMDYYGFYFCRIDFS